MNYFIKFVFAISLLSSLSNGQAIHQDSRCLCKCPEPPSGTNSSKKLTNVNFEEFAGEAGNGEKGTKRRSIYVNSLVAPDDCNCKHVVLPHLNVTEAESEAFCPRCACKYETRSLTIIKVVVILVIWVISILVIYMGFLSCLDPILNKRAGLGIAGPSINYREHLDERTSDDEDRVPQAGAAEGDTPMRTYRGAEAVINRLGNQQNKWKKQVQEQRRNIYDRHAMLN